MNRMCIPFLHCGMSEELSGHKLLTTYLGQMKMHRRAYIIWLINLKGPIWLTKDNMTKSVYSYS